MQKVILTCAVTGENAYNKAHSSFPITPEQIADAVVEAEQAGASALHLHDRDPLTGNGSRDPDLFLDMVAQAVLLGGNVRGGLEDNLHLSRGVFATNGQLVERARTIIESLGSEIASPDKARQKQH